jgi:hypothetical protein
MASNRIIFINPVRLTVAIYLAIKGSLKVLSSEMDPAEINGYFLKREAGRFLVPLPTTVCSEKKAADRAVCAVGNCFRIGK